MMGVGCKYDPMEMKDAPIGMYHCPECGEMVLAGAPHPDYSLLEDDDEGLRSARRHDKEDKD